MEELERQVEEQHDRERQEKEKEMGEQEETEQRLGSEHIPHLPTCEPYDIRLESIMQALSLEVSAPNEHGRCRCV